MRQLRSFAHIRELIGSARGFVDSADEKRGPCDMVNALDRLVNAVAALADRVERAEAAEEQTSARQRGVETCLIDHQVAFADQLERLGELLTRNGVDVPHDLGRFGPCPAEAFRRIMAGAERELERIQADPEQMAYYDLVPGKVYMGATAKDLEKLRPGPGRD